MGIVPLGGATSNVWDEGDGPPVVLLHGFPTSHRLWRAVVPQIVSAGHRVVAPDLAGYGSSDPDPREDVGMERQAVWVHALMDALGLERPLLVAHDVGTAVAQILAARSPERISGLVLIDGVYEENWAMEAVASIQSWSEADAHRLFPVLVRRLRSKGGSGPISEAIARDVLAPYEGPEGGLRLIRAAQDPRLPRPAPLTNVSIKRPDGHFVEKFAAALTRARCPRCEQRRMHVFVPGQLTLPSSTHPTSHIPEPLHPTMLCAPTSTTHVPEPVHSTAQLAPHRNSRFPDPAH